MSEFFNHFRIKKIITAFLLFIIISNAGYSQRPLVKRWDKRFGTTTLETIYCYIEASDGGFLLGGVSQGNISGDKTQVSHGSHDFWIVKIDRDGNFLWDADFGGSGSDDLKSLQQTGDGGYILGGYSTSGISGDKTEAGHGSSDFWIVKIDASGTKLWDRTFGGNGTDVLTTVLQSADGGYVLGGYTNSPAGGDISLPSRGGNADYWILKTDGGGNKIWDARFGGSVTDELNSMQQTADGGYILAGTSNSGATGDKTMATFGNNDYWLIKTDSAGVMQWQNDFGGNGIDKCLSVKQAMDHGYILAGGTFSGVSGNKTATRWGNSDFWLVKTDSLGNWQWDKDFGGIAAEEEDDFGNVIVTKDGGFMASGTSYSDSSGDKTEANLGLEQSWAVKMDKNGNTQWDITIFTRAHEEDALCLQARNGDYLFANSTFADTGGYKTQMNWGNQDYWIVRFGDTTSVVIPPPLSNFLSSDTVLCQYDCISFTDLSLYNPTSWQWTFTGGLPATSNLQNPPLVCYQNPGVYDVTLTTNNDGGNNTLTQTGFIIVKPTPPVPLIRLDGDTLFCSTDTSYYYYQWYQGSVLIDGATNPIYILDTCGNFNVSVSGNNGCKIAVGINVVGDQCQPTTVSNSGNPYPIQISPNPVHDFINLYPDNEDICVTIFNTLGQNVSSADLQAFAKEGVNLLDVSGLRPGVYIITITGKKTYLAQRFVKY